MTKKSAHSRLTMLQAGLEQNLMKAADREMLADAGASEAERQIRRIIHSHLDNEASETENKLPVDARERRRLLQAVIAQNVSLPRSIRMAYTSNRKVTDIEVSALLRKLLRSGVLSGRKKR